MDLINESAQGVRDVGKVRMSSYMVPYGAACHSEIEDVVDIASAVTIYHSHPLSMTYRGQSCMLH